MNTSSPLLCARRFLKVPSGFFRKIVIHFVAPLSLILSPVFPEILGSSITPWLQINEAWGGISFVKTIGAAASTSTGTSISITVPGAGVAAGSSSIIAIAMDPASGTVSCSDSRGNSYAVDANVANGSGTSGVRTIILSSHHIVPLVSGDLITCSHPSVSMRGITASEFAGIAFPTPIDKTKTGIGSNTAPSSGSTATTTQGVELLFGVIGIEGPTTDTFTPGTGYIALGQAGTTSGVNDITIQPEYRLATATGAYSATGTLGISRKWAAAIATYKAAVTTTKLVISSINAGNNPVAGATFSAVVQSQDSSGLPASVVNATGVSLSLKTGNGTRGGALTGTIAAGANQVTISGITYTKAEGGVVLTATRTAGDSLSAADSAPFTVDPGLPTKLGFTTQPGSAITGIALPGPPTVAVQDNFGNTIVGSTAAITMAIGKNPGKGTLSGTTTKNASGGIASFTDLSINKSGNSYTLSASSPGLAGATSSAFNLTASVTDLVVSSLSNPPPSAIAGGTFPVTDTTTNNGNVTVASSVTNYRLSLNNTIDSSDALLAGSRAVGILAAGASSSGTVTVTIPVNLAPGKYFLGACADSANAVAPESSETNNCKVSTTTVMVSAAPSITTLSRTSAPVGTLVTVNGANFGSTRGTSTVTFNGIAGTPTSWSAASITAPVPSGASTGPVVVTVGGVNSNGANFTVTAKLAVISVNGGGNPTTGGAFSVVVQSQDTSGIPANVSGATGVSLSLKTGTGTLAGTLTGTVAAGTGQVTISGVTYTKAESGIVLTAIRTSGDILNEGDSAPITVNAGAAVTLAFTTQPGSVGAGSTILGPPTVTVQDIFGNTVTSSTALIALAIAANPGGGTLSGTTSKNAANGVASFSDLSINQSSNGYTLTASSAGLTGASSNAFDIFPVLGTIAGIITRSGDGSPIGGAFVEALQTGVVKGTAASGGNGNYSIFGLNSGVYDLRASAGGYTTQTQNGVTVTAGSTTVNVSLVSSSNAQGLVYSYDRLGRLKGVVNPLGEAATYAYDAVGNVLSISRYDSSQVSIIEFTPNIGPAGTNVTIYGTGYSTTPSQNTVTFNGVPAVVSLSTSTQIVTSVPSGATTGFVVVTSPVGSATSSESFTVSSAGGAPAIAGFSPNIGAIGAPVAISGSNFQTTPANNIVRFNNVAFATVSSSSATSIAATVPAAGSGRISVTTSFGSGTSSGDFFVPPLPYTASHVAHTGRMEVDGASHTITVGSAGRIGLVVFDGTAGQLVSLGVDSLTLSGSLFVNRPNGIQLASTDNVATFTNFHMVLPVTGTYTIMVTPSGASTGSITVTLSSEVNAGTIIADGASATITLSRVGQRGYLSFSGTAGQYVSLGTNSSTLSNLSDLWIYNPDGTTLAGTSTIDPNFPNNSFNNFHMALPVTGTYKILVDPDAASTGSVTVTLSAQVEAGPIVVDGPSVTATTTKVGQRAHLTFSGTPGQWVSLGINSTNNSAVSLEVYSPVTGNFLNGSSLITLNTNLHMQITNTGLYTVLLDPDFNNTATVTMTLSSEVDGGSLDINGVSLPISTSRVGQRGRFSFSGTSGQQVTVRTSNDTTGSLVLLARQNGDVMIAEFVNPPSHNLNRVTLPATETYYVLIDPPGTGTASLSVAVTSP